MSDNRGFIRTTSLKGLVRVGIGGGDPQNAYARIIPEIRKRCGADVATLFAEPVAPTNPDSQNPEMTWYTSLDGQMVDLDSVDQVAREPIVRLLRERLERLKPILDDPEIGATVASWLFIPSPRDLLAIAGQPVLINWGYLALDIAPSPMRRKEHFAETIGKYVPDLAVPTLPQEDSTQSPTNQPHFIGKIGRAPLIASAIAAAVLAFLLWPNVLLFPDNQRAREDLDRRARLLRDDNAILEQRLKGLEEATKQKVCRLPNGYLAPLAPLPGRPDAVPSSPPIAPRTDLAPVPGGGAPIPPTASIPISPPSKLTQSLEQSVVFVFGNSVDGGFNVGSGFFVTADRILTNRHVIEGMVPDGIQVTSKALGQALSARVVARSTGDLSDTLQVQDFALLAVSPLGKEILKLGPSPAKGSAVVTAGYPGFLVRDDPGFKRLQRGDFRSAPENSIQNGSIMQKHDSASDPLKYLTHSANLGRGNSGGPLLDPCGRVVGVNTAVKNEGRFAFAANFAQDVSEMRAFLTANGVAFRSDDALCSTALAMALPSPAAPSTGTPDRVPNASAPPVAAPPGPGGGKQ